MPAQLPGARQRHNDGDAGSVVDGVADQRDGAAALQGAQSVVAVKGNARAIQLSEAQRRAREVVAGRGWR